MVAQNVFIVPKKISLKGHTNFSESWIQNIIVNNPSIIGLGDLIVKDVERRQSKAGRLDLLLQDQDPTNLKRYEVEIQLGKTDESHIIRTIEYWDIEKKRYPQYEHCAVIIAEDITSRFLNVIGLFNGMIPIIAIKMEAYEFENYVFLTFTKILDEIDLGLPDEEEDDYENTDRSYWEKEKGSKETVQIVDQILDLVNLVIKGYSLNYTKHYIGLTINNKIDNFITFRAKREHTIVEIRLQKSEENTYLIENSGVDLLEYSKRYGKYRFTLKPGDPNNKKELLLTLIKLSKGIENSVGCDQENSN